LDEDIKMKQIIHRRVRIVRLGLLCAMTFGVNTLPARADKLDTAIVVRAEKEQSNEQKAGTFNTFNLHSTASAIEKEKLSDQKKAELATEGLAESVAASHQNQHTIAHGSNSVSQITPKK
jgi:hypothetical protein